MNVDNIFGFGVSKMIIYFVKLSNRLLTKSDTVRVYRRSYINTDTLKLKYYLYYLLTYLLILTHANTDADNDTLYAFACSQQP